MNLIDLIIYGLVAIGLIAVLISQFKSRNRCDDCAGCELKDAAQRHQKQKNE